jgi:hypothetical protein
VDSALAAFCGQLPFFGSAKFLKVRGNDSGAALTPDVKAIEKNNKATLQILMQSFKFASMPVPPPQSKS